MQNATCNEGPRVHACTFYFSMYLDIFFHFKLIRLILNVYLGK